MHETGSAAEALRLLPDIARRAGSREYAACPEAVARDELDRGARAGATLIAWGSDEYPHALASLSDPPPLLWARGRLDLLHAAPIALVGARNASSLGLRMARTMAAGLGRAGRVTVSGFARGIDTACHTASLETGTIAVMAGGVDVTYPAENAELGRAIAERGLIVSEQPMGLQPQARHFPRRNRIIAGLSCGVVVIEAAAKSGSLITARDALDQGREVLAVPGHPFDARASGGNLLIRDGATLVRGPQDVIDALDLPDGRAPIPRAARPASPTPATVLPETPADVAQLHQLILDRLGPAPTSEDELIRDLRQPVGTVAAEIVSLEIAGRIRRQPGGLLSRD